MTELRDDGGPAFGGEIDDIFVDTAFPDMEPQKFKRRVAGMALRDYFAAKFAHAEMVTSGALPDPARDLIAAATKAGRTIEQQVAFNAYKLADAMIAERKK